MSKDSCFTATQDGCLSYFQSGVVWVKEPNSHGIKNKLECSVATTVAKSSSETADLFLSDRTVDAG